MKRLVILSLLSALLAGCVVVPAGGYYRGDGYSRHDYYDHRGYYSGYRGGYGDHGQ